MTDDRAAAGAPADRRALLARLLKERAAPGGTTPAQAGVAATAPSAPGPLSFPQQRLWIVDQLAPGSSAYGIGFGLRFTGPLNHAALESALNLILQRHDVLRAAFPVVDDGPVQIIAPFAPLTLAAEAVAVREPAGARERLARELVEQETRRPFDLARGPVFRARLFRFDNEDHVLAIAFHHIVSDAWSVRVFVRELATAYDAIARGVEAPLEPLSIRYADFAREQHESLRPESADNARLESQLAYWKEQLADAPAQLELPADAARPQVPTLNGALVSMPLSPELSEAVRGFSRREGATLFMTMLAGFQLLLSRLSGQTDVVVGTPIAGRTRPEVENLIGCFLNTLVMRTRIDGDLTFAGLVRRVRETALSAYANQDVPFERVLDALRSSRDVDRMPLFQVFFNMLGPERSRFPAGGNAVQFVMPDEDAAKFDLTLYVLEGEQQIALRAVYNPDLFQAVRIEEMLSQLQAILQQGVARSSEPLAEVTLETDRARQVLPDPRLPLSAPALPTVPESIFARAAERPDDIALEQAGTAISYRDLASRARAIAAALKAAGAAAGDVVAVTGPPSPGFVAAMVGIMASRCVLLTLDRRLPAERKALMLREARAARIVHVGGMRPEDAWMEEGRASLHVDAASGALASGTPADGEVEAPQSGDAAYIFFTSGTTGVPKAVLGVHRGLSHFVGWQRTEFGIGPGDRASQLTGLSFDVVLREIFTPLTSGATLCLRPAEFADELAADRVLPWMEQSGITVLHTVPTLAQAWLADVPAGVRLASLRRVFLAGEPLSGLLVRRWREAFPKTGEIINLYGPTETTLAKFFYRVPADCGPGIQPVGRPLSHTQALVLREGRRLCGIGESGEITIRTPYRTLGYANSVEETERRFVPNPFSDVEGDRIYLTGDRGRYRPDGVLEILGRADDQVKIRGVRIELDEVTAALCKHPLVRQGAVVVREDAGEKRLIAYAVTGSADETIAFDIQQRLQTTLPDYMVPAAVVLIDALPVTANGKLDRSKLPAPAAGRETVEAFVPPRTPVEEDIAAMWRDLLRIERVGVHQNFFDAGGHSLLATQLISRVRSAFRIELPLRAVYEAPTLAGIAARVTAAMSATGGGVAESAPIEALPNRTESPASSGQRQLWLFDRLHPGQATYNIAAAVRFAGVLDREALQRAIGSVVRRHDTLRTTLHGTDAGVVQRIAAPEPFMLPLVDVTTVDEAAREDTVRGLYERMGSEPFDLARGPLFRASLIKVADTDHRVVVVMHHAVGDVWSLGVLFREIAAFYRGAAGAGAQPVPELAIQYGDYAAWQVDFLNGERAEALLDFWKRELEGAPRTLDLPSDRPRPAVQSYQGVRRPFSLSPAVSRAVRDLGRREGVTLFTTLGAAFSALLHRYTRQEDLLIGFPVAGRTRSEVESLIGFFVNMLVLRADLSGDPSFRELLKRIQGRALGAYAHQELPFERLVEGLQPERDTSRNPLFQVAFAVHNTPMPPVDLPGLSLSLEPLSPGRSRFDLTLALWEDGDRLAGSVEYNRDLFEADRIERLIGHYETLLAAATERPDAAISALRVLQADERRLMLEAWNDTAFPYPATASLHELFDRQAAATPDAIALSFSDGEMTYRELDRRSNQLARHLQSLGVGHESLVGLCAERSTELIVGVLGIIKAGAAYVPLDPAYPAQRLTVMADDAQLRVVVCQQRLERVLPAAAQRVNVRIDTDWPQIAAHADSAVPVTAGPDSLAYVIYTSGSTGVPKGAAIPHRGVSRLVLETNYIEITAADRFAQVSSSSFDAATFEIWGALLNGAQLIGIEKNVALSPREFAAEIAARRITAMFMTTTLFNAVAREAPGAFAGMTHLLVGGEALDPATMRDVLRQDPPRRLLNGYGPTESTTFAACYLIENVATDARTVPIGAPIGNTTLYVVDPAMQPVPAGVPGELFIGGDGLARGYLNRPDFTAERFVPNPFATTPGARLYRTGDLARWTADGQVEFLGRLDGQVKIRGFRIELPEIEAVLSQHPGVRDAAVAVHDQTGDKRIAAYLIAGDTAQPTAGELRQFLKRKLPDYMVPSTFTWMDRFPVNANGKIDHRALPVPAVQATETAAPTGELERRVTELWMEVLGVPSVGVDDNFFDLGGHSLLLITLERRLREALGCDAKIVELFEFPTIRRFVEHLQSDQAAGAIAPAAAPAPVRSSGGIAIVGMAGRFPGAPNVGEFWNNLKAGLESVTFFTEDELAAAGISRDLLQDPAYVRARGVVGDADRFDARFFGYTPREAELIDPQQRVFLECAWEALEHAGCDPEQYPGRIGVFAGTGINSYLLSLAARPDVLAAYSPVQIAIASDKDFLPTRVSYKLNLTGPSVNVQTACSTSLVAVHVACQSLISGDCDMALAGGVRIAVPQESGYRYQSGSILSPDGHCRAFDAGAQGTVSGNGVAIVVLKRVEDAIADGDTIFAVVKGSAINNDGSLKVGFTAPAVQGQAQVIADAHRAAGIAPGSVTYVEAHGTGTDLGDPVEMAALNAAFSTGTDEKGYCAIGSLKTNVGHLDAAAGATGLIKAALAVHEGTIPPSLHFSSPNPKIDFASSPFFVNTALSQWPAAEGPRRAGVSSFGLGGTNAHVVLEEPPPITPGGPARESQLIVLSARSEAALETASDNLAEHLAARPDLNLADVAFTLQTGRHRFDHRRFVVCTSGEDAARALRAEPGRGTIACETRTGRAVAFMFPGQGAQQINMGRALYDGEPLFREHLDRCAAWLEPHLGFDLRTVLYPEGSVEAAAERLIQTAVAQPALFAVEYSLAQLWMSWGVMPSAMIGHSLGEYVAACLAGVMTVPDALALVATRGRVMQAVAPGSMLSVPLSAEELSPSLGRQISIAAVNTATSTVVSGPSPAIAALQQRLAADGVETKLLKTSHAFHSSMMDPALAEFRAAVQAATLSAPTRPFISNLTGAWITADQATSADYWVEHLRRAVRFHDGLQTMLRDSPPVLLEVGPGRTLASLGREAARSVGTDAIASFENDTCVHAAGQLWLAGVTIEWPAFHGGERRRRVAGLPTYPFERQRYWIEIGPAAQASEAPSRLPIDNWFSTPAWTTAMAAPEAADADVQDGAWLVFGDRGVLAETVARAILERGGAAISVLSSDRFAEVTPDLFEIRSADRADYVSLFETLARNGVRVRRIVHTWPETDGEGGSAGFATLLALVQAVGQHFAEAPLGLTLVTSGAHDITGGETLRPSAALALGAVRVVPMEYRNLSCVAIDIDGHRTDGATIVRESIAPADAVVALRGGRKWVQSFRPVSLPAVSGAPSRLRHRGVYLITGGAGGVGIELARYLGRTLQARLVLTGRAVTPSGRAATEIAALEAAGAEVIYLQADAADPAAMKAAAATALARFGSLNGLIHAAGADKTPCAIHEIDAARCADQFRPRVAALQAIDQAVSGLDLDFVALTSSLSSVLGAAGYLPYTAAHLYMDAYAQRVNRDSATPWVAINWDNWTTWKSAPIVRRDEHRAGMTAAEGTEAFARVLGSTSATQVIVSSEDLNRRTVRIAVDAEREAAGTPSRATALHPRPALRSEYVAASTSTEVVLTAIWEELLGIGGIGIHDNFFELGGDSVTSIQVVARAGARGLRITTRQAFELSTIAELAAAAGGTDTRAVSAELVTGPVPLTPIQRWFFDQDITDPHHFNQAVLLEVDRAIDADVLTAAVRTVSARHDALRLRYRRERGSWQQAADRAPAVHVSRVDLSHVSADELPDAIEMTAAAAQAGLDLATGRLLTLTWMDLGPRRAARLLIVAHHLVIDAISWGVLLEELYLALDQSASGAAVTLPPVTTPFQGWARALADRAGAPDLVAEVDYWTSQPWHQAAPLPSNGPAHANTVASSFRLSSSLGAEETSALIQDAVTRHNAQAQELLLAALHQTFAAWTSGGPLHVHLEGHGRDGLVDGADLSRTIGWFTTIYPVLLDVPAHAAAADAVAAVKRQLRAVPNGGSGYGVLKYLAPDPTVRRQMARIPDAAVSFLYMGRGDQASPATSWMRAASEPIGQMRSLRGRRPHAIDVIATVLRGQLQVTWTFSEALHHRATVEALSQGFLDALRGIIAAAPAAPALTTEDFPAARLEQDELDRLLSMIKIGGTN